MSEVEFGIGETLIFNRNAVEHLHDLAEFHIADEAHVIELDGLFPEPKTGVGQAGIVQIDLVKIGIVGIGDEGITRRGVLAWIVVEVVANVGDVNGLHGNTHAFIRLRFPADQATQCKRLGIFRLGREIDVFISRAKIQ